MRKLELCGMEIKMFDSIEELPINRYQKYSKYLLIDSGIGSSYEDIDTRIARVNAFMRTNVDDAAVELSNLQQLLYFILSGTNPLHFSFAALVTEIDGEPCNDLTDSGLKAIQEKIQNATNSEVKEILSQVRAKLSSELVAYFPKQFNDSKTKEYYDYLQDHTMIVLQQLTTGKPDPEGLADITQKILTFDKPSNFTGENAADIQYDHQYEEMCLALAQQVHIKGKDMVVLEYYTAVDFLKKQLKNKRKQQKGARTKAGR